MRPLKEVRFKQVAGGFQIFNNGSYIGRVSYQNVCLLAELNSLIGTHRVLVQLARLCEEAKKAGCGTKNGDEEDL